VCPGGHRLQRLPPGRAIGCLDRPLGASNREFSFRQPLVVEFAAKGPDDNDADSRPRRIGLSDLATAPVGGAR